MGERNSYNEKTLTLGKDDLKDKSVKIFVQDNQKHVKHFNYLPLIQKEKVQKPLLGTFDTILSLVLLGPSVVGFWRGTWDLMDVYNTYFPKWLCVLIGLSIHFAFVLIQDALNESMQKKSPTLKKKIFNMVLIRIYIYIFAISSVMHWRGGWEYIEAYFELKENPRGIILKEGSRPLIIATAGALFCIMALRSLRNCVAPPFVFCIDRKNNAFVIPTRFKTKTILKKSKMRGSTAGLPDTLKAQHNASYYAMLSVLDAFFASLVVAPLVVGYWRSVWQLMEIYVYPDNEILSSWISTGIGVVGHLIFMLPQHTFERFLHPDRNRIIFYVMSRVYTVCFAFVCVNGWRGPWQLLDIYTKNEILTVVAPTIVATVALAAMRALRNVSAPPFTVVTDSVKGYFEVLTMFRVAINESASLYILDCLFSVLVIGTLVVFVWRGAWAIIDIYLFPENEVWSSWGSLIVGYSTVAIAFMLQPFMRWLCDRITGVSRLLAADLFLILSLIGTVNVWRGIWNLLNIYLLPDNMELSCWISHWVCFIILVLLGCSNSLLVRGVYIDAEEPAGKCVIFPCYYLRLIFQEQKLKKIQTDQNKTEMLTVKPSENNHIVSVPNTTEQPLQNLSINHKEGDV